jgi:DNA gyrase subunit A
VIAIQTSERNGKVVSAALVDEKDEIVLVSTGGVLIRTKVDQIREMGRSTQGVSLINLDAGTKLAGVEKIAEPEDENGNGNGHGSDGDSGDGNGNGNGESGPEGGEGRPA